MLFKVPAGWRANDVTGGPKQSSKMANVRDVVDNLEEIDYDLQRTILPYQFEPLVDDSDSNHEEIDSDFEAESEPEVEFEEPEIQPAGPEFGSVNEW